MHGTCTDDMGISLRKIWEEFWVFQSRLKGSVWDFKMENKNQDRIEEDLPLFLAGCSVHAGVKLIRGELISVSF
jgi:hypothetical protein